MTGLQIIPKTQDDALEINTNLLDSALHFEYNERENFFFLEENVENYNSLEKAIVSIIDTDLDYTIEGIF